MIRVLLVEDQEIVRRGLKTLLEIKPDFRVVGEAGNGQLAIEQLESLHAIAQPPDVVLVTSSAANSTNIAAASPHH